MGLLTRVRRGIICGEEVTRSCSPNTRFNHRNIYIYTSDEPDLHDYIINKQDTGRNIFK